jgi:hypothetical protein
MAHGVRVALDGQWRGWTGSMWWSGARRAGWRRWGDIGQGAGLVGVGEYDPRQRDYQRTVERVLARDDPSLRELAALARAEQIARIDARQRAVESLLATSPSLVRVERPVNQWLDWGRAESERLSRSDSVYARLDATARAGAERVRGHAQWPAVRQAMRDRVQSSPEHRVALDRLTAAMNATPRCGR